MTETSPVTLYSPHDMPESKTGSCGVLVPGTQGKIVSLKTGENQGPHSSGELIVRGPQVRLHFHCLICLLFSFIHVSKTFGCVMHNQG